MANTSRYQHLLPSWLMLTLLDLLGKMIRSISFDEVSMVGKLLDRFKQIYIFRDDMHDEQEIDNFTEQMSIINERKPHNYNFLTGYLVHASNIKIKTITPEAKFMLNQFWKHAKIQGKVGIRMLKGLFTIAEAHAKLHLSDIVDCYDCKTGNGINTIDDVQIWSKC